MDLLKFHLEYEWVSFKLNGYHLIFTEYENKCIQLSKEKSSHWGPAIYKWEGKITEGKNKEKIGILIGETDDIRARLNQYKSGTQKNGNKYWRENFLRKGSIGFWIMNIQKCIFKEDTVSLQQIKSKNFRLILEQLIVMNLIRKCNQNKIWIVNKIK